LHVQGQAEPSEARGGRPAIAVLASGQERELIVSALGRQRRVLAGDGLATLAGATAPLAVVIGPGGASPVAGRLRRLRERVPSPLVVVVQRGEPRQVRTLLAAGAAGVVAEPQLPRALEPCLRAVLSGQVCVPAEQAAQLHPRPLSGREKQILGLVVMGFMNAQIAQRLFLAESTVKSHLHSAFGKLGVASRNEAVSLILDPRGGFGLGILGVGAEPLALDGQEPA
jgi:DNA-binding NarL/FixJ family response regulator